jgi:hypothetical protein
MACRIVNLDRVKFNDAVASGTYPCAPSTISGKARIFDEDGLLPLYFFARLTEFGIPAARAGKLACEMAECARSFGNEESDRVILLRSESMEHFIGSRTGVPNGEMTDYDPRHEEPGRSKKWPGGMQFNGIGRIIFTVEFYIKHVRQIIAERIAYEASILGEEEE